MTPIPTVLIVGPHGVAGTSITRHLAGDPGRHVITASRRPAPGGVPVRHLSVDLLAEAPFGDPGALGDVTHVVYAAYTERPTMAETTEPNLTMLTRTLDALRAAAAPLEHVVMIGGGKSYGEHLGPYKTPAKESDPRLLGPIFYNDQEDLLAARGAADGFTFTVLRPDLVIGFSIASPMNLLTTIGVYAALSKADRVPLRFPGTLVTWGVLHQFTDADLFAAAVRWALTAPTARNEVFNVTNGDQFRWQHLWDDIAAVFDMPTAAPQPMRLAEQMTDKTAAWDALVTSHGLHPILYRDIAGWEFADGILHSGYDMIQSTIKIRQAGFADSIDTHESLTRKLHQLRQNRYLP